MNPKPDPTDRLIDSLLREHARQSTDEELLKSIEEKLDGTSVRRPRARWMGPVWAIAAAVAAMAAVTLWRTGDNSPDSIGSSEDRTETSPAPEEVARPETNARNVVSVDSRVHGTSALSSPSDATEPGIDLAAVSQLADVSSDRAREFMTDAARPELSPSTAKIDAFAGSDPATRGAAIPSAHDASGFGRPRVRQRIVPPPGGAAKPDASAGFIFPGEEMPTRPTPSDHQRENYGRLVDQPWKSPLREPLSTFSIDVDTASYTNLRRMILQDVPVQKDAVRIEECINYFDYNYEGPEDDTPFAIHTTVATCPWQPRHVLARVALQGRKIEPASRPASNLVFLIDVSGSMQDPMKLPLLKRSLRVLIDQLDERDRLTVVIYAGNEGIALPPTTLDTEGRRAALAAVEKLEAGGSTNGGAGIRRAYELAAEQRQPGSVNRVILATDGDFNVGTTGQGELVSLVKEGAERGVSLSVLGFGSGNFNDAMLEAITNEGDGNYFYIDGEREARRVFLQKLTGTLVTIAKDVKIQVEFNPAKVSAYRLIGYANRELRAEDFADDKVDAGDIGAGHSVTAFYEIVPAGVEPPGLGEIDDLRYQHPAEAAPAESGDWFTLKLRHKHPDGAKSELLEARVAGEPVAWEAAGNDFRFASAVALFGMKLRGFPETTEISWNRIAGMALPALEDDPGGHRAGFLGLVRRLGH